jgi:hypothetical protein
MSRAHLVQVGPLPTWLEPAARLLGPGAWTFTGDRASAHLDAAAAADLAARLRGLGLAGRAVEVDVRPKLSRDAVREARTIDARRRRHTTPGFTAPGVRLDAEGRFSLTPESLALAIGREAGGRDVLDLTAGCGGNTIGFARAGSRVIAVDRDEDRLQLAEHNARVYGVADRVRFVCGDAIEALAVTNAAIVMLDPPWGEAWDRRCVSIADLPLLERALTAPRSLGSQLWLKLPPSFDTTALPGATTRAWFGDAAGDQFRIKFLIVQV